MEKKYKVYWSKEAKSQVDIILEFLRNKWSEKEADNFLDLLLHFELVITRFPKSFKTSDYFKGCRLGLVHRHVTAIYKISGDEITILTVFNNQSGNEK